MASHIRRRKFLAILLGSTAAWTLAAGAQQSVMPVVGFLGSRSPEDSANLIAAFRTGLGEPVSPKAVTSRSNSDGRRATMIAFLCSRPSWWPAK